MLLTVFTSLSAPVTTIPPHTPYTFIPHAVLQWKSWYLIAADLLTFTLQSQWYGTSHPTSSVMLYFTSFSGTRSAYTLYSQLSLNSWYTIYFRLGSTDWIYLCLATWLRYHKTFLLCCFNTWFLSLNLMSFLIQKYNLRKCSLGSVMQRKQTVVHY